MSFANPWGLLALSALPVIAAIHLYHRRYPRMPVAGLHLWGVARQTSTPGRRRERLPITRSLVLELLAALFLALVLARPQVDVSSRAVHLVAVLDGSASMSTRPRTAGEDRTSFRDRAIEKLEERLADLPSGSVVTLIETGRRPALLFGPRGEPAGAAGALQTWDPQSVGHTFQSAWDLATQLAADSGSLVFVTDRLPDVERENIPARLEVISVGTPQPNLAITTARWILKEGGGGEVYLRVVNLGPAPAMATLTGRAGDRTVFSQPIELDPGRETPWRVDVPGGLGQLEVTLDAPRDALGLDSRVRLVEPRRRLVNVALTLPADDLARQSVSRVLTALPDWQPAESEQADLVIAAAGEAPSTLSDQWWLGIGPVDPAEAARKRAVDLSDRSAYVLEKRHPLLEGVVLGGVIWGGVQDLSTASWDFSPLVTAGPRALLVQRTDTRATAFVLNIDLARSNLVDTPDWPILVSNLLEECRDSRPGLRRVNYRVTEAIRLRVEDQVATGDDLLLLTGAGRRRQVARGRIVEMAGLTRAGLYTLSDGERELARFSVNFQDPIESNLQELSPGRREPVTPVTPDGFQIDSPYTWLILLGIMLIMGLALADWHVLSPARTSS